MIRGNLLFLGWGLIFLGGCGGENEPLSVPGVEDFDVQIATASDEASQRVVKNSYIVAFRNLIDDPKIQFSSFAANFRAHTQALSASWAKPFRLERARFLSSLNLSDLGSSFVPRQSLGRTPWLVSDLTPVPSVASLMEVSFPSSEEAVNTLREWSQAKRIWFAEPNYQQTRTQDDEEDRIIATFSNNGGRTPWLDQIQFVQAIQLLKDIPEKTSPIIAIIDSGFDIEHKNIKDAVYDNSERQNKLCYDDLHGCNTTRVEGTGLGNGEIFPAGLQGFNQSCDTLPEKTGHDCGHGTHVAGIIAGRNSSDFSGICPYCRILPVKVVGEKGGIADSAILAGLAYISGFKENGKPLIRVINASIGKFERSRSIELFIRALRQFDRGTLLIASAGNEDTMKRSYPAGYGDVLSVSNVYSDTENPIKSESSNFGMYIDISAPGDGTCAGNLRGILSSVPGGSIGCKVGTSMAAPVVSGVAGLLLVQNPDISASQMKARLKETAVPEALYQDGVNNAYRPTIHGKAIPLLGSGIVNALGALQPESDTTPPIDTRHIERVQPGCGTIGSMEGRRSSPPPLAILLLSAPFFAFAVGLQKRRRRAQRD